MTKKLILLFFPALALLLAGCSKDLPIDLDPKNQERQYRLISPNLTSFPKVWRLTRSTIGFSSAPPPMATLVL